MIRQNNRNISHLTDLADVHGLEMQMDEVHKIYHSGKLYHLSLG